MYTLRTIKNGNEFNQLLTDNYALVKQGSEDYNALFERTFNDDLSVDLMDVPENKERSHNRTSCYAFIVSSNKKEIPLLKENKYYIVNPNGETFSNVSFKK